MASVCLASLSFFANVTLLPYVRARGIQKDVVFVDHNHPEDVQARESSSRTHTYEAEMIIDLVEHLLKQGYQPGDIAVLTAYLGQVSVGGLLSSRVGLLSDGAFIQLKFLKSLLAKKKLVTVLEDRDVNLLNGRGLLDEGEIDSPGEAVKYAADSLLTLRSVDHICAKESNELFLLVVCNVSSSADLEGGIILDRTAKASIGFLKLFLPPFSLL